MLFKKIIGITIILLNIAGLGFLLYSAGMILRDKLLFKRQTINVQPVSGKKKDPEIVNDDIIPDEDDLLKDMDLSDLDNLKFDDFK
jgi:hypothetical protein